MWIKIKKLHQICTRIKKEFAGGLLLTATVVALDIKTKRYTIKWNDNNKLRGNDYTSGQKKQDNYTKIE